MRWIALLLFLALPACDDPVTPARADEPTTTGAPAEKGRILFAFWNVENLFDADDDANNDRDDEFTPENKWSQERYQQKLAQIASVIAEMNPHLLGLAEIENRRVLDDLVKHESIVDLGFEIAHRESSDHRGIDVALLYRRPAALADDDGIVAHTFLEGTRDILEVRLKLGDHPLRVFVNHWPSRWGGTEKTRPKRQAAAQYLRKQTLLYPVADDLLIIGDFNDEPYDDSVHGHLAAVRNKRAVLEYRKGKYLYNATWPFYAQQNIGTYYFNRDWSWLLYDQIIVSKGLLMEGGLRFVEGSMKIHAPDRIRDRLGRPLRFGRGGKDASKPATGFSDHFPITGELVWH